MAVNNADVARRIGVSRAAVSRFRNGSRLPRIATRRRIAEVFEWAIPDQATAEAVGRWAVEFDKVLTATCSPASARVSR